MNSRKQWWHVIIQKRLDKQIIHQNFSTLITVQWYNDADSQGNGQKSLLGTPPGTLSGTA